MHHFWDLQIGVGKSWLITEDITRVSLPFTFIEKNANCVHNGVLIFDIQLNEISKGYFQIGGETCLYFKYDFIGEINIEAENNDYNEKSVNEYKSWKTNQFPIKSITSLGDSSKSFGAEKEVKPMFMSVYGILMAKIITGEAVQPDGVDILTVHKCFYLPIRLQKVFMRL